MSGTRQPLKASDWYYMAEGGSRVVMCYRGSDPALVGKVLRVRKCAKDRSRENVITSDNFDHHDLTDKDLWAKFFSLEQRDQDEIVQVFSSTLLQPLLSGNQTDTAILIRVNASFLTQVAENIASMRPATRREASDVDLKARCAVLAQNHRDVATGSSLASAPFISLEIKPKCGFVDQINRVDVARFQMHQSLKLADGRVLQTSNYDPLDLFHGRKKKNGTGSCSWMRTAGQGAVNHALHRRAMIALIHEPQNNFFVVTPNYHKSRLTNLSTEDSQYPEKSIAASSREGMYEGIHEKGAKPNSLGNVGIWQLARTFGNALFGEKENMLHRSENIVNTFIDLTIMALRCAGVFSRIRAAQRLDRIGIEGAIRLAARVRPSKRTVASVKNTRTFLKGTQSCTSNFYTGECAHRLLRNFVISTTVKDCSIILSINRLNTVASDVPAKLGHDGSIVLVKIPFFRLQRRAEKVTTDEHMVFLCRTAIVDQDMKSISKLRQWLALDRKIRGQHATNGLLR